MSEHQSVTQLKQWLERQKSPPVQRSDKIVGWCVKNVPGFKKIISHEFLRVVLLTAAPLAVVPILPIFTRDTAAIVFMVAMIAPRLISWCAGLNWDESFSNYTPAKQKQIDQLRRRLQRVHMYHPELQPILDRLSASVDNNPSETTVRTLEPLLDDVLLQLPVWVAPEDKNDKYTQNRSHPMSGSQAR